ncbi:MAG: relaxase/mobilization nuclease domain-containing protein [Holophagales bacterium]|jgi:hypothetical protein|nr:relaxase/mobilization nuclease domain-containing protein [Holophagales bacterium]
MIAKKILPRTKGGSKASNISQTAEYVLGLDSESGPSKVPYFGSCNCEEAFLGSRKALVKEITELALETARSDNPCGHYMLSWQEHENPTNEQIDEAVKITLKTLGLSGCKAIYGKHVDTFNVHVHLFVNRVDPETKKVHRIGDIVTAKGKEKRGRGFDKIEIQKAIAIIEHEQGWEPQEKALYQVLEDGKLGSRVIDAKNDEVYYEDRGEKVIYQDKPRQSQAAQDMEVHSGEPSEYRKAIDKGFVRAIAQAKDWDEAQANCKKLGGTIYRKGSGALLIIEDAQVELKLSGLDRKCSSKTLEKRFGKPIPDHFPDYHRDHTKTKPTPKQEKTPEAVQHPLPNWEPYREAVGRLRKENGKKRSDMKERHKRERDKIFESAREKQKEIGKSPDWRAKKSQLAFDKAVALLALREKQKMESAALSREYENAKKAPEILKLRPTPPKAKETASLASSAPAPRRPAKPPENLEDLKDLRAYEPVQKGNIVYYFRKQSPIKDDLAFVDRGNKIVLKSTYPSNDDILAALQLGQAKWGKNQISRGSQEYIDRAVAIALKHGIELQNPEWKKAKDDAATAARADLAAQQEAARIEAERIAKAQKEQKGQPPKPPAPEPKPTEQPQRPRPTPPPIPPARPKPPQPPRATPKSKPVEKDPTPPRGGDPRWG